MESVARVRIRGCNRPRRPWEENMKTLKLVLAVFPTFIFASSMKEDLFQVEEKTLFHIAYDKDEEAVASLADTLGSLELQGFETKALGLLEIDENDEELIPWTAEKLTEDLSIYVEKKAAKVLEEFDDVFSYDVSYPGIPEQSGPTLEKVPDVKRALFGRPKAILSKEAEKLQENQLQKKKSLSKERVKAPPKKDFIIKNTTTE